MWLSGDDKTHQPKSGYLSLPNATNSPPTQTKPKPPGKPRPAHTPAVVFLWVPPVHLERVTRSKTPMLEGQVHADSSSKIELKNWFFGVDEQSLTRDTYMFNHVLFFFFGMVMAWYPPGSYQMSLRNLDFLYRSDVHHCPCRRGQPMHHCYLVYTKKALIFWYIT